MGVYRRVWWVIIVVVGVPALAAAVALAPFETVVPMASIGALAGAGFALGAGARGRAGAHGMAGGRYRAAARAGGLTAAATVAVVGLVYAVGPAGLALVGLLAAASPMVVSRARAHPWLARFAGSPREASQRVRTVATRSEPATTAGTGGGAAVVTISREPAQDLRVLSDTELCYEWRRSFVALQRARLPVRCVTVVQARARYLDEMERRHPAGFHAWLAHGARAASDPTRYLK
ncbi:MAG: hypothetical protein L0H79_13005 [Intrasporangium sp.]|uniref:hypothetical protein n=1 Tax=Intrasporangium sp. TaxID=1925024 RepID=UPI0026496B3D|nr:hypothetical protein [Intrasporangium sp.]MDN5796659.1 hypothetical protein [Intrasporangium sp.]